jgi:hypothetical protein
MLEYAMKLLVDPWKKQLDMSFKPTEKSLDADEYQIEFLARSKYMSSVSSALMQVYVVAGQKGQTLEERKGKLFKDGGR